MKMFEPLIHHKVHKYTISGILAGGALLLLSLASQRLMTEPQFHPLEVYIILVPGAALLLRSLRPPIGVLRGTFALIGGMLVGTTPILFTAESAQLNWLSIAVALLGAALLGASFSEKVDQEVHKIP
jgi:hypothetical protein